jgi:peptide/nickel transport system substrate-binding protein
MTRRDFLKLAGTTSLGAVLAACAPAPTPAPPPAPTTAPVPTAAPQAQVPASPTPLPKPKRGGVLRIIPADAPTQFDPMMAGTTADVDAMCAAYDNLATRMVAEKDEPIRPGLAESWEYSQDGLSYTFKLRKGVTFHHGKPFTAKDVEYTFQRIQDPKSGSLYAANLRTVSKTEVVDDYTIRFVLKEPNVTFPYLISAAGFGIVPSDRTTEQLAKEPSGTGPFKLAQYTAGERLVFKRNEQYWDKELPYLDELQFSFISEPAAQLVALTSGSVDIVDQVGIENLAQLEKATGIKVVEGPRGLYHLFAMHATEKPFDDVRVRQAFKYAIDRAALQKAILQGRGSIANDQPIGPENAFWANVAPFPYDPAKAKQLLAAAGYADGLKVTLSVAEIGARIIDAAVALQEMVKAAGITITIDKVPMQTYYAQKYMQTPFFVSWWPLLSEPDHILSICYLSKAGFNESGWGDPKLDDLIAKGRQERDPAKRRPIYAEIQKLISEQGGVLIPYFMPLYAATRANVNGYAPAAIIRPQFIWLG